MRRYYEITNNWNDVPRAARNLNAPLCVLRYGGGKNIFENSTASTAMMIIICTGAMQPAHAEII